MMVANRYFARSAAVGAALAACAFSSGTQAWEMSSYGDFVRGRFDGISLSRDGRLSLAPKMETVFTSDQPVIWSVAEGPDGTLYAGTGHRGRLYRIDRSGKSSLLWTAEQPEIFAVTVDRNGAVYAGTSPDGKVYRIEDGKATEYFAPKTRYIWSLAAGADGALYVGTGDQGKVFRVTGAGRGELYYDTGQSHITGLAVDAQGRVLAGTAFRPRTRPSCCTMRACRKSAPSFPCRMARYTRRRWAAPWPSGRKAPRRPRRAWPAAPARPRPPLPSRWKRRTPAPVKSSRPSPPSRRRKGPPRLPRPR
jgi:hypothetical protein